MVTSGTTGGDTASGPPGDTAETGYATDTGRFLHRVTAWVTVLGAPVGLLADAVLIVEKLHLAANPDYVPSCSINPVLDCGSVMSTPQAEAGSPIRSSVSPGSPA